MSEIQTVCALVHELTHIKLRDFEMLRLADENAEPKDKRTEEIIAESTAYAVLQYFSLDTGDNSFGYVATWSRSKELKELNASLDTIRKTAADLIEVIDEKFREIAKERDIVFSIGEQQTELIELPAVEIPETLEEKLAPNAVYARYCNQIADAVKLGEAYANAILNADEQNARTECELAVKRAVMNLFAESEMDHIELYRQYADNPDFKGRLDDYIFMRTYLEPQTAQRNGVNITPASEMDVSSIIAVYAHNAKTANPLRIGANVLMPTVFDDMNFNRAGKKIRVMGEEPIGKYQIFSREEFEKKTLYFLTASGMINRTDHFFNDEWDDKAHKWFNIRPTEAEFDAVIPQIAERFENDLANPEKWVLYQHAAVLNRIDECEAHNIPIRKLREEAKQRKNEEAERERREEKIQKQIKYDNRVDEIAKAIEKGAVISVGYNEHEFEGKNPVLDLFKIYGISLPLRTQGWINTGLAEITDGSYRYYKNKHKGDSTAFSGYLKKLREAIKITLIEQKRQNSTDNVEVKNTVGNKLYEKFAELFLEFAEGKYSYLRLESKGFEPLSLEWVFGDRISVMHTYELNDDLCYDPMMEFRFNNNGKTMEACMFQQSIPPIYQYFNDDGIGVSIDGNGRESVVRNLQSQLDNFASQWFDNIAEQGFMPVRGTIEVDENGNISKEGLITDKTVRITFDADGNPIMPESEKPKITELDLSLPDPTIGFSEMSLYGYTGDDMFPVLSGRAVELFDADHCVYLLYPDNTEAMALDRDEIRNHDGLCGIERGDWEHSPVRAAQLAIVANSEGSREAELLYGDGNRFGIYQIPAGIEEARDFRFAPMEELEALGLSVDRDNYKLVYTAPFSERIEFLTDRYAVLDNIYEAFNGEHPSDYIGRSVSVSDVIVLKYNGGVSSHFIDSEGFVELGAFLGEENENMQPIETTANDKEINKSETLSQVGTSSREYTGATSAELESDVKSGKVISLLDFSKAVNAERNNNSRNEKSKTKPTLMERLETNKQRAARQGQTDAHKINEGIRE